jgi:hypothetical protein
MICWEICAKYLPKPMSILAGQPGLDDSIDDGKKRLFMAHLRLVYSIDCGTLHTPSLHSFLAALVPASTFTSGISSLPKIRQRKEFVQTADSAGKKLWVRGAKLR